MAGTLEQKVDRILLILENDPTTNQEGLVSKVNRLDKEQTEFKAKFSGVVIVLTVIFNVAFWLFNKFIK